MMMRNLIGDPHARRGRPEDPGTSFILQLHQNLFCIDHIERLDQISRVKPDLKGRSFVNHLDLFFGISKVLVGGGQLHQNSF